MRKINPRRTHYPPQLPVIRPRPGVHGVVEDEREFRGVGYTLIRRRKTSHTVKIGCVRSIHETPCVEALDIRIIGAVLGILPRIKLSRSMIKNIA